MQELRNMRNELRSESSSQAIKYLDTVSLDVNVSISINYLKNYIINVLPRKYDHVVKIPINFSYKVFE